MTDNEEEYLPEDYSIMLSDVKRVVLDNCRDTEVVNDLIHDIGSIKPAGWGLGSDFNGWFKTENAPKEFLDGRWLLGAWVNEDDDFGYVTSTVRYGGNNSWYQKIGQGPEQETNVPSHVRPMLPRPF